VLFFTSLARSMFFTVCRAISDEMESAHLAAIRRACTSALIARCSSCGSCADPLDAPNFRSINSKCNLFMAPRCHDLPPGTTSDFWNSAGGS
jgi:hypothetical protein